MTRVPAGHLWRITYQREGWPAPTVRHFDTEPAARRFVDQVAGLEDRFAPLVELTIERADVGAWAQLPARAHRTGRRMEVDW